MMSHRALLEPILCLWTWLKFSSWLVQPEEEKAERGPYKCLQISEGWVSGGWGQALFSGAQ